MITSGLAPIDQAITTCYDFHDPLRSLALTTFLRRLCVAVHLRSVWTQRWHCVIDDIRVAPRFYDTTPRSSISRCDYVERPDEASYELNDTTPSVARIYTARPSFRIRRNAGAPTAVDIASARP